MGAQATATDEELMRRLAGGERDCLHELVRRHLPRILGYAQQYIMDWAAAEDIAQQVFLEVFRGAARFDATANFLTWLFTITHRRIIDQLRRVGAAPEQSLGPEMDNLAEPTVPVPQESVMVEALLKVLPRLAAPDRQALFLKYYQGLCSQEIAAILGGNAAQIDLRISRARKKLRQLLIHR